MFVNRPPMPPLSSGVSHALSMPQPLAQSSRGGGELQALASLANTLQKQVQEDVQRVVEQKLEQLSAPVTQAQAENANLALDPTALVSDDVVQVLMNKMRELAGEARFRSGRLR